MEKGIKKKKKDRMHNCTEFEEHTLSTQLDALISGLYHRETAKSGS